MDFEGSFGTIQITGVEARIHDGCAKQFCVHGTLLSPSD
jgi:Protein of unknown function (DUF3309)